MDHQSNALPKTAAGDWLVGGGETGKLVRSVDWSQTPLGPMDSWPQTLRATVSLCLASDFPMALAWGPEHVMIYNDAYRSLCGGKHPRAMGGKFRECWASAWPVIREPFEGALAGEPVFLENQRMFLDRNGGLEETFFTFSFSPIRDETGMVAGLLHPVTDLTRQTLEQRRLNLLCELTRRSAAAKSMREACDAMARTFADYDLDLPFVLIYLSGPAGGVARLAGSAGLDPGRDAAPEIIDLAAETGGSWPLAQAARARSAVRIDDLQDRFGSFAYGPYPESPRSALVMPVAFCGEQPLAFLIAGASSRRGLDEAYRAFYDRLGEAVGNIIVKGRAHEREREGTEAQAGTPVERVQSARGGEEALSELSRRKDEFLANMSHEIRSPMTSILGYSDILLSHLTDPDDIECVKTIKQSGNYLLELINDILDLSKIESGRLRIKKEAVLLPSLLDEVHSLMSVRARGKKLPLVLRYNGPIPERVETDRARLRQTLINLVSNAVKFTERGSVQVIVTFFQDRSVLQMEVVDTGIGIHREDHERIFQPFTQADSSATREHGGTGLGLAITRRLVEMMEGEIAFESEPDRGTTFRVSIPMGHLPSTILSDIGATTTAGLGSDAGLDCRVLIADDRREIQYLVRHFIEDAGGRAVLVADGKGAIQAAREAEEQGRPFDVVIMDIQMPGVDGFEATRTLRARGFAGPIIALTAGAMEGDREKCLQAGCDDYLSKPIDRRALIELVSYYAQRSRKRNAERGAGERRPPGEEKCRTKVLLVDDSRVACRSTGLLLEMSGHEVRTAFTAESALDIVRDFEPDVFVLDIKLPDMDGYALLARLKGIKKLEKAKFIALSGYEEEETRRSAGAEFHHFLRKPVDPDSLAALFSEKVSSGTREADARE